MTFTIAIILFLAAIMVAVNVGMFVLVLLWLRDKPKRKHKIETTYKYIPHNTDAEAIRSDWEAVGKDIANAMKRHGMRGDD